jgi:CubicO group peptidase (beta-lactamase class C family)
MNHRRAWSLNALLVALVLVVASGLHVAHVRGQAQPAGTLEQKVDAVFARWTATTPGCAVGVSSGDTIVLQKGYGMADLEHGAANAADTIFEAGSVSKQFTAAAVLLLARDGKLSLDDPARQYLPELPDYGTPLTIRHMLQHTSGLRDWGEVAAIGGWPRTSRVYTHAHVLDIVSRQRALNFAPGSNWSYSNTGYNLAAIIVSRVSGMSFADFTRTRIFEPLGMTHTSWRDDFRRIVKDRAIAYAEAQGGFRQDMPFENVHGNGGLLTTVGDLLRWNENFVAPKVGDEAFLREEQQPGRLSDGRADDYALGLFIRTYKGLPEVNHSGSTAGYRAYLTRYPEQHLSVAVLCNASSGAAERYAHAVADLYLGDKAHAVAPPASVTLTDDEARARAGMYRNTTTGTVMMLVAEKATLHPESGPVLIALSGSRFVPAAGGRTLEFDGRGSLRVSVDNGTVETYVRVEPVKPTPDALKAYAGTYASDEAEVTLQAVVEGTDLKMTRRPDTKITLRPLYKDAFSAPGLGTVIFRRTGKKITGLSVVQDRVWDLRFARRATPRS